VRACPRGHALRELSGSCNLQTRYQSGCKIGSRYKFKTLGTNLQCCGTKRLVIHRGASMAPSPLRTAPATCKLATSLFVNSNRGTNVKCSGTQRLVICRGVAPRLAARRMAPSPLRMAYSTKEVLPPPTLSNKCNYQLVLES